MKLIVKPKTKKEEKAIKTFLEDHSIDYLKLEEEAAVYEKTTAKKNKKLPITKARAYSKKLIDELQLSKTNVQFVNELKRSVEEVKLAKKGKIKLQKAKDILNEL
jgi:hypothetical protein